MCVYVYIYIYIYIYPQPSPSEFVIRHLGFPGVTSSILNNTNSNNKPMGNIIGTCSSLLDARSA